MCVILFYSSGFACDFVCSFRELVVSVLWIDYATPARPVVANTLKARVKCIRLGRGSNKDPCPQGSNFLSFTSVRTSVQERLPVRVDGKWRHAQKSELPTDSWGSPSPSRWRRRRRRMQGPELPLTDEHAWQSSPLPFPETAEDPLRSKSGTRLLRARAGHVGAHA